jgi:hypothetical protein
MKRKDLGLIAMIVVISGVISFFLSNLLFRVPKNQEAKVEVVQPITADFVQPDTRYFNSNSVDPTQNITIGGSENPTPFNNKTQ